jgi:hypothetical protein
LNSILRSARRASQSVFCATCRASRAAAGLIARLPDRLPDWLTSRLPESLTRGRPSRLAMGTAAAAAAALAGVVIAVTAGSTPTSAVASPDAAGHASVHASGSAPSPAPSGHDSTPAPKPSTPSTPAKPAKPSTPATPAKQAPAKKAPAHKAPAKPKPPVHHRAARKPYLIYDSVTPGSIPAHHAIAAYATGNYAAPRSAMAGRKTVFWIDTTGTDHGASALDVEPGDATPSLAASWAWHRLHNDPHVLARIYTNRSEWAAVKAAVARLSPSMRSQIRWWIADPTGYAHVVPGSAATQWYWGNNYDITTATPRFG